MAVWMLRMAVITVLMVNTCLCPDTMAQGKLSLREFYDATERNGDLTAKFYSKSDHNGNVCALIKVEIDAENCTFKGSNLIETQYKGNEYWVYVYPDYFYRMYISCPGYDNSLIDWESAINRQPLQSGHSYVLRLNGYSSTLGSRITNAYLAIRVSPPTATVFIDDKLYTPSAEGEVSALLQKGEHTYMVSAQGYTTKKGVMSLQENTEISVSLASALATINLSAVTTGVSYYVNDELKGKDSWSGKVTAGNYRVEARKEGYHSVMKTVTLNDNEVWTYRFDALKKVAGQLNVNYLPLGTEVWLDGKTLLGTTPAIFYDISAGPHDIELRKNGYTTEKKSVTVTDGNETTLTGNLSRQGDNVTTTAAETTSTVAASSSSTEPPSLPTSSSTSSSLASSSYSGTHEGYDYVDLGLPSGLMWATCNVGASSPEDYGDYYAWGEISTKNTYTEKNSVTYKKRKYGDISGNPSCDVARAKWGGSWRMPTLAEFEELLNKCTWTWTTQGGHNGYKVTGPNGNSIFLPAASGRDGTSLDGAGEWGDYWSSTPYGGGTRFACHLYFSSGRHGTDWSYRYYGLTVRPVRGMINGHEYVDLGLSVKWATCNVGASSPEEYGDYYAWGETSTKSSYDTDNCETWGKSIGDIKGTSRDVAHVKWGGSWRMPTEAEFEELLDSDNCTWTWTTQGGHKGYKVTSKKNGNSIFLPAAGCRNGMLLSCPDAGCSYWSSTPYESSTQDAYYLLFFSSLHTTRYYRYLGHSVRPVAE